MTYSVGIIGYGKSAKIFHIPFVSQVSDFKLQAICQRTPKPDNNAAKDFPDATIHSTTDDLINDPNVDLVILCTPAESHLGLGKQCLEAGKHVVIEKPFTPTSAEADELIAAQEKSGKLISVFHNRRWDVDFRTVLSLLESKKLGRILEFETHFDRWSPAPSAAAWKSAGPLGGVIYELGPHLIDQIVFAFGLPKQITGFVAKQKEGDGPPDACIMLLHYDGMLATVKATAMSAESKQLRFWVRGTKGSFKKYYEDPQEKQLVGGMSALDPSFGKDTVDQYGTLTTVDGKEISEAPYTSVDPVYYTEYYRELAKALNSGSPAPVTAKAGRDVMRLIELALESAKTGRTLDV